MKNNYEIKGKVVEIDCKGTKVLVSLQDLKKVSSITSSWRVASLHGYLYCKAKVKGTDILMHRFITNAKDKQRVDHKNHNTLDNTRDNLVPDTTQNNNRNRRGPNVNSTSGIRGVTWVKRRSKWQATIGLDGGCKYLGYFDDKYEAGRAVVRAQLEHYPSHAISRTPIKMPS